MSDKPIRVRYAPSPTGHLHIGNARTALFNYLFAQKYDGKLVLRIEDTDRKRNVENGEENQLKYLDWLGIHWDEGPDVGGKYGPYRQSERFETYESHAVGLLESGRAYKCYCTDEDLEEERKLQKEKGLNPLYSGKCRGLTLEQSKRLDEEGYAYSIRFATPNDHVWAWNDLVKGDISVKSEVSGDFVIIRKDGTPTYNFAVVVDDHLMDISHVLRGEDHISNTHRQLMIYSAFGWEPPQFGHMTLIVNENHKKLSKRDESVVQFIEQYDQLGYIPSALFNYIALLGWSPKGDTEILSPSELISLFDVSNLSRTSAMFDAKKLSHISNQHLRRADIEDLTFEASFHLQKAGLVPKVMSTDDYRWVSQLVELYREQLTSMSELQTLAHVFFDDKVSLTADMTDQLKTQSSQAVISSFLSIVDNDPVFNVESIAGFLKSTQAHTGCKGKSLYVPLRLALTGQEHGRDMPWTVFLLGKEKVVHRLKQCLN